MNGRRRHVVSYRIFALLAAWLLFAAQGSIATAVDCSPASLAGAQPAMDGMASMPMMGPAAQGRAAQGRPSSDCRHCHPHGGAVECPGVHGCNGSSVIATAPTAPPVWRNARIEPPLAAQPRISHLPFAPPLRPPAA